MHEFIKWTATEAVAKLSRGEVSPLQLLDAAEARIAETNPQINAMVTLCFDRAREHAKRLMNEPRAGRPAGFLHGLPIAVKDNTDVEGVRCTSGSRVYEHRVAPGSDPVVQRLEAHGAIVVGKTNLPEFAAGGNTFNDVFGATRNPWDTRMSASGSSGGSAAALAAGQIWLATGNDFGGSIRTPAAFCSVSGLRPSPGRVARLQKQPFNPLSVEGPMARTVADMSPCRRLRNVRPGLNARAVSPSAPTWVLRRWSIGMCVPASRMLLKNWRRRASKCWRRIPTLAVRVKIFSSCAALYISPVSRRCLRSIAMCSNPKWSRISNSDWVSN
jgi:Asp-tRNA(Asn)/Glu-tRNA(Gln) amidotransferase A subunit family amidase